MSRTLGTSLRLFLVLLLSTAAIFTSVPVAQAAAQADLQVNLSGPAQSAPNAGFTYTITASNLGPSAADGARVEMRTPDGATGVSASCGGTGGGAVCGAFTVSNGTVSGVLSSFPGNGSATITVKGTFGSGSSASATATITPPSGVTEVDATSNTSTQNTALAQAQVNTSTTVSPSTVVSGGTVTVTTTFENVGTVPVKDFRMQGTLGAVGPVPYVTKFFGSTVCGSVSDVGCPPEALGEIDGVGVALPFNGDTVTLEPGKKIVLVSNVQVTRSCDPGYVGDGVRASSNYVRNQVSGSDRYTISGVNFSEALARISGGPGPCPALRISKTVDKSLAPSGEERTFTIRLTNPTDTDVTISNLYDNMSNADTYGQYSASGTVRCDSSSTAPCPFPGGQVGFSGADVFAVKNYQLPAGAELVLTVPTVAKAQCVARRGSSASNMVRADNPSFPNVGKIYYDSRVYFQIDGLPPCQVPNVSITDSRTSPAIIGVGDVTSDKITLKNNGTAPTVSATLDHSTGGADGAIPFDVADVNIKCIQEESTGDCNSFTTITRNGGFSSYQLGAGEKLVLERTAKIITTGTCPVGGSASIQTRYYNRYDGEFGRGQSSLYAEHFQEIRCNDVTVETNVSTLTPEAGAEFPVAASVSNQVGVARDTAFSMVLPANGYVFDPGAGDSLTCEVVKKTSTQNVVCPDLSYDAANRTVSGVVPVLGAGDSIRILVNGSAGVVEGRSYPIATTVKTTGDTVPGSNTSVVNFGVANTLVPTFGEVTVNLPEGASLPQDLVFPVRMVCRSSGNTDAEVRVASGATTGRAALDETVWRNDDCVVSFQRPEAPAGYEWDGDFTDNPVALNSVQAGATARTAVALKAVTPAPSPSPTDEPSPSPEPTTPAPEPTTPGPSPTDEPSPSPEPTTPAPEPTTPGPEPTTPAPEPTTPAPEPTTPGPSPTRPGPSPTRPGPGPTTPGPSPTIPGPEPTTPGPSSGPNRPDPSPVVPGAGPGPGGPGSAADGGGAVDVKTGFDQVVSQPGAWWGAAGLAVLGVAAGAGALIMRRRDGSR